MVEGLDEGVIDTEGTVGKGIALPVGVGVDEVEPGEIGALEAELGNGGIGVCDPEEGGTGNLGH